MFGSTVLEIGIGLAFVYFVLSLAASAIAEAVSQALRWRSKNLEAGIENLLSDEAFARKFYQHSLVKGLYKGDRKPSYIPAQLFTTVILDLERTLGEGEIPPQVKDALRVFREQFPGPAQKVERAAQEISQTVKEVRDAVEDWFDQAMDRVSGWYKRKLQVALWAIGSVTAAAVNADTIATVESLNRDSALREAIVAAAVTQVETGVESPPGEGQDSTVSSLISQAAQEVGSLRGLGVPLGWGGLPVQTGFWWWVTKAVGLLLTGAAVSLGAPFWFSILNKLVNLRGSGDSPKRAQEGRGSAGKGTISEGAGGSS